MSTMDKVNELNNRRKLINQGGEQADICKARERVNLLLDADSFVEIGAFVKHRSTDFNMTEKQAPADGIVTGYGTIEGRLVYVYSQDSSVLGGSVGEMHAKKIVNIYQLAMKMGAPVIGLLDSAGLRLQESTDGLNGYGEIFVNQTMASGVIPQIAVVLGDCAGGATIVPSLADFTFMTKNGARLFMNSPNTMDKSADFDNIATADVHAAKSGIVDFVCENEEECLGKVRLLVDMLPSNNMEDSPVYEATDDLNRVSNELNEAVPSDVNQGYDINLVIAAIADNGQFLESAKEYADNMVTGFIRLNGGTVGIVANQTLEGEAFLNNKGCEKAAKFVNICDSFNIPIVTLTDVAGFESSIAEEQVGISKFASKLVYAFANATVPKINVVVRKAFGSAYTMMNSKHVGADIVYAWPTAQISVMNADSAVRIMYADEIKDSKKADQYIDEKINEYIELQASPYAAASRGYIDDVVEPAVTRKRLIVAIEMLISKKENRPAKKHSTVL